MDTSRYPKRAVIATDPFVRRSLSGDSLKEQKMTRLAYLDEAGTDHDEKRDPVFCVAGVLVDADTQWKRIEAELLAVAKAWLPPKDAAEFIFHATDLYHGSGYWDRAVWPEETRHEIMADLATIIEKLNLPVICSHEKKKSFGWGRLQPKYENPDQKKHVMYGVITMSCIAAADKWVGRNHPEEVLMVVAEDTPLKRKTLKTMIAILRTQIVKDALGPPLERIPLHRVIDTVNFHTKRESPPLQLADLCAFHFKRAVTGKPIPARSWHPINNMAVFSGSAFSGALLS